MHIVGRMACVARNQMQLRHGHVQLPAIGVFKQHHFIVALAQIQADQAHVAAYAMLFMHHRVAGVNFGQIAQAAFRHLCVFAAFLAAT